MITSRKEYPQNATLVEHVCLERVCNFKYLGVDIKTHESRITIQKTTTGSNKCYFSLFQLFKLEKLLKTDYKTLAALLYFMRAKGHKSQPKI